jgi:hypothetical protein
MSDISNLDDLIPKSLDEIIRKNRDKVSLRLAIADDFAALPPMVSSIDHQRLVRATINEWRMVCIVVSPELGGNKLILTGMHQAQGCTWCTSAIVSVDLENSLALTSNSIYQLGSKGEGEPDMHILLHICHCLNSWGMGEYLGALPIFY